MVDKFKIYKITQKPRNKLNNKKFALNKHHTIGKYKVGSIFFRRGI